jgi:dihydroneopterin aldolase / 2-amino-4-hydroxy-6-hydroxymethyldihydropteridine diphosphokinase
MFEIIIKNLKLKGYHGVNPEEKINGQEFLFNVKLKLARKTFKTGNKYEDNIGATVNYSEVIALIKKINTRKKYDLLETLCEEISAQICSQFPGVLKAGVKVEKTSPPIKDDIESVGVKFYYSKNEPAEGTYINNENAINPESPQKNEALFYLSIGSNLADREENLKNAVARLAFNDFIQIIKVSSIYESEPMYVKKQGNFYNIVLKGKILKEPGKSHQNYNAFEFLGLLKSIEHSMGRKPFGPRYGPRIIDLDLLYFNDEEIISDLLMLPHPGILERKFVLVPFAEIDKDFFINGKKISDLIAEVSSGEKVIKVKDWKI